MNKKQENKAIQQLTILAENFIKDNFNIDLNVPIKLNGRLSRALGRFVSRRNYYSTKPDPIAIELSKDLIKYYDNKTILDVLKHECVHYALCELGQSYSDNDMNFINTCKKLDIALTNEIGHKGKVHIYHCGCGNEFKRKQMIRTQKRICRECKGELFYITTKIA